MATSYTETLHASGFLVSEASGHRSRDKITIASGNNLKAGTVLGRTATGTAAATSSGNTGNGTMGAITVSAGAQLGAYRLRVYAAATNAGAFQVTDPNGNVVGVGNVAAAFSGGGLAFTLADGAADFVVGDSFTITVSALTVKYAAWDPTVTTGLQVASGILLADCDATSADKIAVGVMRHAEVNGSELVWGANVNLGTAVHRNTAYAMLAAQGVVAR